MSAHVKFVGSSDVTAVSVLNTQMELMTKSWLHEHDRLNRLKTSEGNPVKP